MVNTRKWDTVYKNLDALTYQDRQDIMDTVIAMGGKSSDPLFSSNEYWEYLTGKCHYWEGYADGAWEKVRPNFIKEIQHGNRKRNGNYLL